jgi:hypothetical protein
VEGGPRWGEHRRRPHPRRARLRRPRADVRTFEEYVFGGHVECAKNVPLVFPKYDPQDPSMPGRPTERTEAGTGAWELAHVRQGSGRRTAPATYAAKGPSDREPEATEVRAARSSVCRTPGAEAERGGMGTRRRESPVEWLHWEVYRWQSWSTRRAARSPA